MLNSRSSPARIFDLRKAVIESLSARKILDSRGNETIEVLINGYAASAPAGASVGAFEAKVIPADEAVKTVNTKLQELIGTELNQLAVDVRLKQIDGTQNFSKIGGNASIAISSAVYRAIHPASKENVFPLPLSNVFGGGKHGGRADIQEFLVCPSRAKDMLQAVELVTDAYHRLKGELLKKSSIVGANDEGALVAEISDLKALDLISDIADDLRLRVGLDLAATTLFDIKSKSYIYKNLNEKLSQAQQIDFVLDLIKKYKLFYVEDPFHEQDLEGFAALNSKAKKMRCLIVGDDLTATNPLRIVQAFDAKAISGVIIKPNQIGTISQTREAVELARKHKIVPVISHRSGETSDVTIAHLALDWQMPIIKAGMGDMTTKLNELVRIWETAQAEKRKPRMARL